MGYLIRRDDGVVGGGREGEKPKEMEQPKTKTASRGSTAPRRRARANNAATKVVWGTAGGVVKEMLRGYWRGQGKACARVMGKAQV